MGLPPSDLTIYEMILTQCAVCATELGLTLGKKCGRCSTRYCGPACQKQHWEGGGHDKLCRKIKKAGGAEQYNANKKYAEAVSVAAEASAGGHKGPDLPHLHAGLALENKGGPRAWVRVSRDGGLRARVVSGGASEDFVRGGRGEQFGSQGRNERFKRWYKCSLCEQRYHGVVHCALGWACWKTSCGRPEADSARLDAISLLGIALSLQIVNDDVVRARGRVVHAMRRLGDQKTPFSACRAILRERIEHLGEKNRPCDRSRSILGNFEAPWEDNRHTS